MPHGGEGHVHLPWAKKYPNKVDLSLAFHFCLGHMCGQQRKAAFTSGCGRSSGVERNLAKVDVVSSNLIARSKFPYKYSY